MLNKKSIVWVATVDRKHAFFYQLESKQKLKKLDYKLAAKPVRTDPSTRKSLGRVFESASTARHIIEPRTDDRTLEAVEFIKDLIKFLEESLFNQAFDKLILIASPRILGLMRKKLSGKLKKTIIREIDKDYIHISTEQIQEHLANF